MIHSSIFCVKWKNLSDFRKVYASRNDLQIEEQQRLMANKSRPWYFNDRLVYTLLETKSGIKGANANWFLFLIIFSF